MRNTSLAALTALALLTLGAGATSPLLHAQEQDAAARIPDDTLTAYARAHLRIGAVRQRAQDELAASRNKTLEVQTRIRETMRDDVRAALESQGLSREQFDRITFLVSTDPGHRKRLEAILERLSGGSGG